MIQQVKKLLFGSPLTTSSESHERLGVPFGLAIFASDALSSSAYATDEILFALVGVITVKSTIGPAISDTGVDVSNLYLGVPVAITIALLLGMVVMSYRQLITAYPDGGGAYVVAKDNLGPGFSLLAAASLMLDYVLTVAVSVSAGVAALMAAFHPNFGENVLFEQRMSVGIAVATIVALTYVNLRGLRESAKVVAFPAYLFIGSMFFLIIVGVARSMFFGYQPIQYSGFQIDVEHMAIGLLFLKSFAHGCAALTGIEAISNGVKAFKEPAPVSANRTMTLMGGILAFIFIGLTYLALVHQVIPVEGDTVVSQIARKVLDGQSPPYYLIQFATMTILMLAANTSFGGFPRLAMILATDSFLPRQLMNLGDRLVFSNGIVLLGTLACVLTIAFGASVHALMPMYAIGVFLSFTLAQAGMVVRFKREMREQRASQPMEVAAKNVEQVLPVKEEQAHTHETNAEKLAKASKDAKHSKDKRHSEDSKETHDAKETHGAKAANFDKAAVAAENYPRKIMISTIGAVMTGVVCVVLCVEKFVAGAWIVLVCLPVLTWMFRSIRKHYDTWERQLAVAKDSFHTAKFDHTVLVLVAQLNKGVAPALQYAMSISDRVEAVHVELNPASTERLVKDWEEWNSGIKLTVLKSPYRSLSRPLLKYIDEVEDRYEHDVVTIVIPEFVSKRWWHNLLHNQTAIAIKTMLLFRPGKVVTTIRYHLSQ